MLGMFRTRSQLQSDRNYWDAYRSPRKGEILDAPISPIAEIQRTIAAYRRLRQITATLEGTPVTGASLLTIALVLEPAVAHLEHAFPLVSLL